MPERLGHRAGCLGRALTAVVMAAAMVGCASTTPAPTPTQVSRLEQLFVQALPLDWVVTRVAAQEPQWPLQQRYAGKYTREQLACVRAQLTPEKVVVTQREDARAFARRHPARVAESIEVLQGGGAEVMSRIMRGGIEQGARGQKRFDAHAALAGFPAAKLRRFVELMEGSEHAELRQAIRLQDSVSQSGLANGRRVAQSLLIAPMMAALEHCGLPLLMPQERQPSTGSST